MKRRQSLFSTSRLFSGDSGDSGTATLLSPRIFQPDYYAVPRVRPGCHSGICTTCSGYKHFALIDEKTSLPLSMRGAYIATTAPYLNIWCLQYFPFIQRRQRNRHNICLFLSNYHIRRHMCLVLSPIDLNLAGHQKHIHNYVSARLFTLSFIVMSDCLPYLLDGDNSSLG